MGSYLVSSCICLATSLGPSWGHRDGNHVILFFRDSGLKGEACGTAKPGVRGTIRECFLERAVLNMRPEAGGGIREVVQAGRSQCKGLEVGSMVCWCEEGGREVREVLSKAGMPVVTTLKY